MKSEEILFNPFRMLSPELNVGALEFEKLHELPVSESISVQEGALAMISKLMEMIRLLSKAVHSGSHTQMEKCARLGKHVHDQEEILTAHILNSEIRGNVLSGMIRLPYRLERIGDMLESILHCCRVKVRESIQFSDKAYSELDQLFAMLGDMLNNLRDSFKAPNRALLQAILAQGGRLDEMIEEYKRAHWKRVEQGVCAVKASSVYRDILDSADQAVDYVEKMAQTLLALTQMPLEDPISAKAV